MGNCFTKTYEIPISSGTFERPPPSFGEQQPAAGHGKPPRPPSRRPTLPKQQPPPRPSGRPPLPSFLSGSLSRKVPVGEIDQHTSSK